MRIKSWRTSSHVPSVWLPSVRLGEVVIWMIGLGVGIALIITVLWVEPPAMPESTSGTSKLATTTLTELMQWLDRRLAEASHDPLAPTRDYFASKE